MQRGNHARKEGGGIRRDAAINPRVQVGCGRVQPDFHGKDAAQAVGERGDSGGDHAGIGDRNDVGGNVAAAGLQERPEVVAAAFFFAFDQEDDVHREVAGFLQGRFDAENVREDLAFVIRRAPGVDATVFQARLEWGRGPFRQRVRGLDVVVAVDQDRPAVRARFVAGEDDRMAARGADFRAESHAGELVGQPFRAGIDVRRVMEVGGNAREAEKLEEIVKRRVHA